MKSLQMKTKIIILALCLFCQFCLGQILTGKPLHGMVVNDSVNVESGYVLNVNSNTITLVNSQGFFDIMAKTKDTLLISSLGLKSQKNCTCRKRFCGFPVSNKAKYIHQSTKGSYRYKNSCKAKFR